MNEPGNDVFSGATFAGDKDRNVGGGHFPHSRTHRLHDLGVAKDNVVGGNVAQRLRQIIYRKCCHKTECLIAVGVIRMH